MASLAFAGKYTKTGDWSYYGVADSSPYKSFIADAKFNEKAWVSIYYLPQLECRPYMLVRINPKDRWNTSLYYKDQNYQIKIDGHSKKEQSEFIASFSKSIRGSKLPLIIDYKVFLSPDVIEQIKTGKKLQHFYQGEHLGVVSLKGSGKAIEKSKSACNGYLKSGGWKPIKSGIINGGEWDEVK